MDHTGSAETDKEALNVCDQSQFYTQHFFFQGTLMIYVGLFLFEGLPASMVLCGAASQAAHLVLLASFPFFQLASPTFIVSVGENERGRILLSVRVTYLLYVCLLKCWFFFFLASAGDRQSLSGFSILRRELLPFLRGTSTSQLSSQLLRRHCSPHFLLPSGHGVFHALPVAGALRLLRVPLGKRERPSHDSGEEASPIRHE